MGSDGEWHPPDEEFVSDVPGRDHPVRRVAVVLLAVALVGATTLGVWLGTGSPSGPSGGGPPLSALDHQVAVAVAGTGPGQFGVSGLSGVDCRLPGAWTPGTTFTCTVFTSPHRRIGVYDGTVTSPSASGGWQWTGRWYPVEAALGVTQ